jgi:hypothetical protein
VIVDAIGFVQKFSCLQDKCHDNCCVGWSVDVSREKLGQWSKNAPELLSYTEQNPFRPEDIRMILKKDKSCSKLEGGLCGIHSSYGQGMLPDICNYYPQIYKRFGDSVFLTATLSCPSICQIVMDEEEGKNFAISKVTYSIKKDMGDVVNFLPGENLDPNLVYEYFSKILSASELFKRSAEYMRFLVILSDQINGMPWREIASNIDSIIERSAKITIGIDCEAIVNDSFRDGSLKKVLELFKSASTRNKDFTSSVILAIESYILNNTTPSIDSIDHEFDKFLRRFVKAKLCECCFPYGRYFSDPMHEMLLIASEYLIFKLSLASYNNNLSALTNEAISKICHCIDREFYSKKRERVFSFLEQTSLNDPKNIVYLLK